MSVKLQLYKMKLFLVEFQPPIPQHKYIFKVAKLITLEFKVHAKDQGSIS